MLRRNIITRRKKILVIIFFKCVNSSYEIKKKYQNNEYDYMLCTMYSKDASNSQLFLHRMKGTRKSWGSYLNRFIPA